MAVNPSRKSSPAISNFTFFSKPELSAYFFNVPVKPLLKPDKCVPPSCVLILFTYECKFSAYEVL